MHGEYSLEFNLLVSTCHEHCTNFDLLFCPSQNPFADPGLYTEKPGGKKTYSSQYSLAYTCIY